MWSLFLQMPGYSVQGPVGLNSNLTTIGGLISAILPYIFTISGIILFLAIIWSGFNLIVSGGNPDKVKSASGCITNAFIGFIIIVASYFLIQILEVILHITIF